MELNEFELAFREKCKLESVLVKKFEYIPEKELLKLELNYNFDSMPIPNKFEINGIDFSRKNVFGIVQKKNFKKVIESFHT